MACFIFDSFEPIGSFPEQVIPSYFFSHVDFSEAGEPRKKRAPGWLGYVGDEILPSYIGMSINHYKDPY